MEKLSSRTSVCLSSPPRPSDPQQRLAQSRRSINICQTNKWTHDKTTNRHYLLCCMELKVLLGTFMVLKKKNMDVLLQNFENLKTKQKKKKNSVTPSAFLLSRKGLHSWGDMSPFIQTVFHVQLGKEAFCVPGFPSPVGECQTRQRKQTAAVCVCVLARAQRPVKPRTPFLGWEPTLGSC